tara:strand:- start:577 stop:804 length:228 start_codon:yes stop_codon:yes gene_type:complete
MLDSAVLSRAEHQLEADYHSNCALASLTEEAELYTKALDSVLMKLPLDERVEFIKQFFPDSWSDDSSLEQDEPCD